MNQLVDLNQLSDEQLQALWSRLSEQNLNAPAENRSQARSMLVAYYTKSLNPKMGDAAEDCQIVEGVSEQQLRDYCLSRLPAHMCPTRFIALNRFPTLPNGKLALKKLPQPGQSSNNENNDEAVDNSPTVRLLTGMLGGLLGMDEIRASDNFFEIGGDSITAIQFISKIREAGFNVEIEAVIKSNTINDIAALCVNNEKTEESHADTDTTSSDGVSSKFNASGLDDKEIDDFLDSL